MKKKQVTYIIAIIIPLAFIINAIFTYSIVVDNTTIRVEEFLRSQMLSIESIIDLNRKEALKKIQYDIKVAHHLFYTDHKLQETNTSIPFHAKNQITSKEQIVQVKTWLLNNRQLQFNYNFVDELQKLVGGTATIFQRIPDGFLRISTNVPTLDSNRAVGTFIPNESEVIKTILKGDSYFGRAYVVNDWYLTAYEPIWINGKIKGMLYVGVKEKEFENLRDKINSLKISKTGYVAVFDETGTAIIHPTHQGKVFSDSPDFSRIKNAKNNIVYYTFENTDKVASVKFYEPFRWYILLTLPRNEPFKSFLSSIQISTAIFSIIISAIMIYIITMVFNSHNKVIRKQNLQLETINTTKDKLFSIISHDLKNPFNAIIGLSRNLYDNYYNLSDDERYEHATHIHRSSVKNYELLDNLLHWSRSQLNKVSIAKSDISLYKIITDTIDQQNDLLSQKKITVRNLLPSSLIISGDQDLLNIVFRNLLSNAIKYSKENSEVLVYHTEKESIVTIYIKDSGTGMSEEKLKQLFNFESIKSEPGTKNEKGTGLGLAICKDFIERHNGSIRVESKENKGSNFIVTLPVATLLD